jgi:hypothetical protein
MLYAGLMAVPWCALLLAMQVTFAVLRGDASPLFSSFLLQALAWGIAAAWEPQALSGIVGCGLAVLLLLGVATLRRSIAWAWPVAAAVGRDFAAVPLVVAALCIGPHAAQLVLLLVHLIATDATKARTHLRNAICR